MLTSVERFQQAVPPADPPLHRMKVTFMVGGSVTVRMYSHVQFRKDLSFPSFEHDKYNGIHT